VIVLMGAAVIGVLGVVAGYSACESEVRLRAATDRFRDESRRVRELAPDPAAIPPGQGWWCYVARLESDRYSDCTRVRSECDAALARARDRAPDWAARACEQSEHAACFTCREGGHGTAHCYRTSPDCDAGRDLFLARSTAPGPCSKCDSVP